MIPKLHIIRTPDGLDFPLPSYVSKHHAGLILQAAIPTVIKLEAGERVYIPIGFGIGIPDGFCGQVVSLPEVAKDMGIIVLAAPQIINPADRDPLFILIQNASRRQQILRRGQAIAQLLIIPAYQITWNEIAASTVDLEQTVVETMLFDENETDLKKQNAVSPAHRREIKTIRERTKAADDI